LVSLALNYVLACDGGQSQLWDECDIDSEVRLWL